MAETSQTGPLEYIRDHVITRETGVDAAVKKWIPARVNPLWVHPQERRTSLSGRWDFRLDPENNGLEQRWFEKRQLFTEPILVPGSWQGQGFGGEGEDEVADFRLRARVFRATYRGSGWYARGFQPPTAWQDSRIWLLFGGVHPSAEVWLNGSWLGSNAYPFLPFGFEIGGNVRFDQENLLVVRVHEQNRMLGFTYNFQGNWSGLYRDVELVATGAGSLEQFRIYPEVDQQRMRCVVDLDMSQGCASGLRLEVTAAPQESPQQASSLELEVAVGRMEFMLPVESPRLWSPDHPALYRMDARLTDADGRVLSALSERTGFVKLSTQGKHFLINDQPYYLRGTGDFLSCPETGCPDTDRDRWRRKLQQLRSYGYNYVRCQSFVYTPEYYDVADEVGLLVQSEMGMLGAWGGFSMYHVYPWPQPTRDNYAPLKKQWDGVALRDVNHPSANIYCMSNEYGAFTNFPRTAWQCYHDTKAIKPTSFVIWTDGGYREDLPGDFVNDEATVDEKCAQPVIQHEFRWWSSFPDVRLMGKYQGAVRPYAAELAQKVALERGTEHLLVQAAENSQRLQLLEAKYNMELFRRAYPRLAGICHFNAMDTNPSPQGILDEFYEKKVANPAEWLQTNGDTVILSDLGCDNVIYSSGDRLACHLWVSDFAHPPLQSPTLSWKLVAGTAMLGEGQVEYAHIAYQTCPAGIIDLPLSETARPMRLRLAVELREGSRLFTNAWDLWLFPRQAENNRPAPIYLTAAGTWLKELASSGANRIDWAIHPETRLVLTESMDEPLADFIRQGGRVLLAASEGLVRPTTPSWPPAWNRARYFFTPPANYPTYEDRVNGTILLDHPALGDLPHQGFADLLFFRMIGNSAPLDIGALGLTQGEPILRCIHQYAVGRPLAYLVECALGRGGLILCSLDLDPAWPEARYLYTQLCSYAASDQFRPAVRLSEDTLRMLITAGKLT